MNYLITGSSGFIGRSCIQYILANNFLKEEDKLFVLSSKEAVISDPHIINIKTDNSDYEDLKPYEELIENGFISILIGGYIPKAKGSFDLEESILDIQKIHALLSHFNHKKVIYISSVDVYGLNDQIIDENSALNPIDPYGALKIFIESLINSYCVENKIPFQILRLGHIYGPGEEKYKKFIPVTIKKLLNGENPLIYSDGSELRSFLFVDDCCNYIWKSIFLDSFVGPINVVSSRASSILHIMNILCDIHDSNVKPEILNKPIPTRDLVFNTQKLNDYLGAETISLEEGLNIEYEYCKHLMTGDQ